MRLSDRPRNAVPDAGASYLGTYTLANPWTLWLLEHEPGLLSTPPSALHSSDVGKPPTCAATAEVFKGTRWYRYKRPCGEAMKYRPGAWCCYQHRETVRVPTHPKYERGTVYDADDRPIRDVTKLLGMETDILFFARPGEKPKWRLVKR